MLYNSLRSTMVLAEYNNHQKCVGSDLFDVSNSKNVCLSFEKFAFGFWLLAFGFWLFLI